MQFRGRERRRGRSKRKKKAKRREREAKMADLTGILQAEALTHFSDLLRALWAPCPHWPSALVIWPILLKVELIERIDLLWVGRHSSNNYLT